MGYVNASKSVQKRGLGENFFEEYEK